jgi:hypothetical protein
LAARLDGWRANLLGVVLAGLLCITAACGETTPGASDGDGSAADSVAQQIPGSDTTLTRADAAGPGQTQGESDAEKRPRAASSVRIRTSGT